MKGRIHLVAGVLTFMMAGLWVAAQSAQIKDFRPINDERLRNPDPGDWLNWRRTLDGWGYSPLDQINRQNVGQLQLAWSWAMQPGSNQPTPLVHDGVMYRPQPEQHRAGARRGHRRSDLGVSPRVSARTSQAPGAASRRSEASRSGTTRSSSTPPTPTSSRSTPAPAKSCGTRPVADRSKGYEYTSGPIIVKGKVVRA